MPEQLPAPGSFADKVQSLDAALTRRSANDVARTWRNQSGFHDPDSWPFRGEYYLSDGGYSRIVFSMETGKLFLTSNSRAEVKAQWAFCKELISDVETCLQSSN